MLKFIAIALTTFSVTAFAKGMSAHRDPNVDFREYLPSKQISQEMGGFGGQVTPQDVAVPLANLDLSLLVDWTSDQAHNGFQRLRDERFVEDDSRPEFIRRESWLYPDDGCFARAALAKQNLMKWGFHPVKKLFAFGNLHVKTKNSPSGQVSWWYHVVDAIRVNNQPYVLDPAIEPQRPLLFSEWVERMGGEKASITLAICDSDAYIPSNACYDPGERAEANALSDQKEYLDSEWTRLEELNRDPNKELGDQPPWLAGEPNISLGF